MPNRPTAKEQRATLLQAGYRLAETCSLAEVTQARIAAEAAMPEQALAAQFKGLKAYFQALQLHYLDGQRERIVNATMNSAPGVERLQMATEAYLDGCLERRKLRAWLMELRATDPELQKVSVKRNNVLRQLMKIEFDTLRVPHAEASAKLYFAMIQDAALSEHLAGHKLPEMRAAMTAFLR